ncbi:TspO/MBR family protein [Telmatospirillum siberiense]|nr:TspO/MBR family protein [Telmatospirillum siberiense]
MIPNRPSVRGSVMVAAVAAIVVAMAGGNFTDVGSWYQSLKTPSWKPPAAAFPVIWAVIATLTAASGLVVWGRSSEVTRGRWAYRQRLLTLFLINGLLNMLWGLIFFHVRRPDLALIEGGALWLSTLVMVAIVYRRSLFAGILLLPYLLWVSIASRLNYEVVLLNGPFG